MWTIYDRRDVMSEADCSTHCSGIHRSKPDGKRTYWAAVFTGVTPFYWWAGPRLQSSLSFSARIGHGRSLANSSNG